MSADLPAPISSQIVSFSISARWLGLRPRGSCIPVTVHALSWHRLPVRRNWATTVRAYPGTCRTLGVGKRRELEAQGRRAAWRFRAPERVISFTDAVAGRQEGQVAERFGDFLVRRSDGVIAYQLAVVVDDALMGVTQVVRGADLLPSTFRQLALWDALGYPAPTEFAHVPLLLDPAGRRMAKRDAAEGLPALQARGQGREQVLGMLAQSCGLATSSRPVELVELLESFDRSSLRRLPTTTFWPESAVEPDHEPEP